VIILKVLNIGHVLPFKSKNLREIIIQFKPEALYAVGILRKILEVLAENEIPILYITSSILKEGRPLNIMMIVDFSKSRVPEAMLVRKLKEIDFVDDVKIYSSKTKNLFVDRFFERLNLQGRRCIIFRDSIYYGLFKSVVDAFGTGGASLLYQFGKLVGKKAFEDHIAWAEDNKEVITVMEEVFRAVGFGKLEIVSIDRIRKVVYARIYDSFEGELFRGSGNMSCNFIRGILAGWFSRYFNSNVVAEELKCIAKGDPYCEMKISVV